MLFQYLAAPLCVALPLLGNTALDFNVARHFVGMQKAENSLIV